MRYPPLRFQHGLQRRCPLLSSARHPGACVNAYVHLKTLGYSSPSSNAPVTTHGDQQDRPPRSLSDMPIVTVARPAQSSRQRVPLGSVLPSSSGTSEPRQRLIAAMASGPSIPFRNPACLMSAEKDTTLHDERPLYACNCHGRRREVQQTDHSLVHHPRLVMFRLTKTIRPINDQRHVETAIPTPMNPPWLQPPVVGEEHDHSVVSQSVFTKLFENPADTDIHSRHRVEIASPFLARDPVLGVVGRRFDVLGRRNLRMPLLAYPRHTRPARRMA